MKNRRKGHKAGHYAAKTTAFRLLKTWALASMIVTIFSCIAELVTESAHFRWGLASTLVCFSALHVLCLNLILYLDTATTRRSVEADPEKLHLPSPLEKRVARHGPDSLSRS